MKTLFTLDLTMNQWEAVCHALWANKSESEGNKADFYHSRDHEAAYVAVQARCLDETNGEKS